MSVLFDINKPQKFLIVLHGAIGDVTHAFPLVVRLKENFPNIHLTWAVEPASYDLVRAHPLVDEVVLFQRKGGLLAYLRFIQKLREMGPYDVVLDLQRHFKSGVTALLSGGRKRIGFARKGSREGNWLFQHHHIPAVTKLSPKIRHFQLFADLLGAKPLEPLRYGFEVSDNIRASAIEKLESEGVQASDAEVCSRLVVFVIGSTWETKNWPARHFRDLARKLVDEQGFIPVIVGGKSEIEKANSILAELPIGMAFSLAGQTSLPELAAILSLCRFVVACDSGPMHIAASVGATVISLWGATSPLRAAPVGSEHLCLQASVACSPCFLRSCPGLGHVCLEQLPVDAVLARVQEINELRFEQKRSRL